MPLHIPVSDHSPFSEPVWVRSTPEGVAPRQCACSLDEMCPQRSVNIPLDLDVRVCTNCGGLVTWEMNDRYNQVHGFSGYDEYPDEPESDEE